MRVAVIGGCGYLGGYVCRALKKQNVRTIDRSSQADISLDVTQSVDLHKALQGMDVIINLVGLTPLREPKNGYEAVHVELPRTLSAFQKTAYIVHISALGASTSASTAYLRTKAQGESYLSDSLIIRPSLLFSQTHPLYTALVRASFTRMFPRIPALFQPVDTEEFAQFIVNLIQKRKKGIVEVGGPEQLHLFELAHRVFRKQNRSCVLLPSWLAYLGATVLAILPSTRIGFDQVRGLDLSNVLVPNPLVTQHLLAKKVI